MTDTPLLRTYLVEDNATIRENLIATLEDLVGIEPVGWAATEDEGSRWLARDDVSWDLAIVDLFLKQGNGLGVLQACGARDPKRKVIVLTNYATADVRARCTALGADAVFDKSTDVDALLDFCADLREQA